MKLINKKILLTFIIIGIGILSCKNDSDAYIPAPKPNNPPPTSTGFASLTEFYAAHEIKAEEVTFDVADGLSYTTAKGTNVKIYPNAFVDAQNKQVTGEVKLTFKDLYSKTDMMFSGIATETKDGLLKSGGEFFVKVEQNGNALQIANGSVIQVEQPPKDGILDNGMRPYVLQDGGGRDGLPGWVDGPNDSMTQERGMYIFSLYKLSVPTEEGTWCNTDNPGPFKGLENTELTVNSMQNRQEYDMDVFLLFTDVNTMVPLSPKNDVYTYIYAPVGFKCTVVAVGVKDKKLYSAFIPITISSDLNVSLNLKETTDDEFTKQVTALND